MATNLIESYKNRLAISESVHMKSHNGAKMSAQKKLMVASVLNNTSKFLTEAFNGASATQRSDIGDFKRFCLNVSTIALPNLILPELMLVQPMASFSGYVTYLKYTAGTPNRGVEVGTVFNSPYTMGQMTEERMNYTSSAVVEKLEANGLTFAWTPVIGTIQALIPDTEKPEKLVWTAVPDDKLVKDASGAPTGIATGYQTAGTKVRYMYNNELIPQTHKPTSLPTLTAKMASVNLQAHARRIAVYYSQLAAFQMKNDYGTDMGQQLAAQAQGELAYEIDSEGVAMLSKGAELEPTLEFAPYDNSGYNAISRSQYYEMFSEVIARAKAVIYKRTQKFAPNYMVVSADVLTIMPYLKGWVAAPATVVNGPYFAGTVDGIKVFVSPMLAEGEFFFGVNGSDLQTAAAIYAPYMAIVPTQLLGFADGTMSQGFSTMYDMKLLSTYNRVNGEIVEPTKEGESGEYSYLLAKGRITADAELTDAFRVEVVNAAEFPKA